jgi:hypothetical protein
MASERAAKRASGSLQPDCCAAAWKRLALTLAEESQAVLDNAHWEVSFGSGDLRRTIKAVRELQRSESTKPHNAALCEAADSARPDCQQPSPAAFASASGSDASKANKHGAK